MLNASEHGGMWSSSCGFCLDSISHNFDPSIAGNGTHTIVYTITSLASCVDSSSATIIVDACLDINNIDVFSINIYPNPVNDQFTINTGNIESGSISISDLLGREIIRVNIKSNVTTLYVGSILSKGNYFVRILSTNGKSITVKKIIKM